MLFFLLRTEREPDTSTDASSLPEDTRDAFRAASGDTAAFERLVRKYEKYVCTTVFSVIRNRDDSFDVAQEVFLKLYHSIGSFKGESSFSSWLYRIAKNSALDFLRKQKKAQTVSLNAENDDGEKLFPELPDPADSNHPEKAALAAEKREMLYAALNRLTPEHREMILLRDINGYTYEEISDMLGLESGTVKSRLFRAREALRKILAENHYF